MAGWFRDQIQEDPATEKKRNRAGLWSRTASFRSCVAPNPSAVFRWPPQQFPR
jgi:hypothetical protein